MNDYLTSLDTFKKQSTHPPSNIHIRLKQRNGKKCLTMIEGLATDLDYKKISKYMRHSFQTSVAVVKDNATSTEIIQLAGDHRENVKKFLEKYNVWDSELDPPIKMHGF